MNTYRAAIVMPILVTGCSLIAVQAPDTDSQWIDQGQDCTESYSYANYDSFWAGLGFPAITVGAAYAAFESNDNGLGTTFIVAGGVLTVTAVLSGWHGFRVVGQCRNEAIRRSYGDQASSTSTISSTESMATDDRSSKVSDTMANPGELRRERCSPRYDTSSVE